MNIIIHRGTHQIGGCATEIKSDTNRIIIDVGAELDGNEPLNIPGVTCGASDCDAVFLTHYHGDHIGLMDSINRDVPIYMGALSLELLKIQNKRMHNFSEETLSRIRTYSPNEPISFGNIQITPYMVDHSAIDSYFFKIKVFEDKIKSILHTGDFRTHGFKGKGLFYTLEKYVGKVDVLICEGTTLNRTNNSPLTEQELSKKANDILCNNKYVFVACSSMNFDRIAAITAAVPRGKYCVCDKYQKELIDSVVLECGKYCDLFQFRKMLRYGDNLLDKMEQKGFCMFIRLGGCLSNKLLERFKDKDPLIIYSMWSGYLKEEVIKKSVEGYRLEYLHTSGHADMETLSNLSKMINPKIVIPIHTEVPLKFPDCNGNVLHVTDGQEITI